MKTRTCIALAIISLMALVFGANAQTNPGLNPLTSFGVRFDGSIQPLDVPWIDIGNNQRGMAYDPVTGYLVFVDTHSGAGGSSNVLGNIYILDGINGTIVTNLNTNGIVGGAYADAGSLVADDGAVYVCNQVNNSGTTPFIIYRWDSVLTTNAPSVCFSNFLTPAQRYGTSMDIRGAGANTQIIIGSLVNSTSGTNVVVFTTADGTNFASNVLGTDATTANFNDGIAFGPGDSFYAKKVGAPLRWMSFNLGALSATTIKTYDSTALGNTDNLGPIAVDNVHKLLAAIDVISGTTGPEHVRLYDISNTNRGPVLLDIKDYTPNNANASAPPGYLDFGGGKLYSYVINNGLIAYSVDAVPTVAPTILSQPAATNRMTIGRTITLSVSAFPAVNYQWTSNGVNIASATNGSLVISNLQVSYSGTYSCVVSNAAGTQTVASQLVVVNPTDLYHLNLQWSAAAGAQPYIDYSGTGNVPNQRSIAYNALSNQLYVVSRSSPTTSNYLVYAINATNGAVLYTLNTNGIQLYVAPQGSSSGLGLDAIGVADDGAIYACNETPNAYGGSPADPAKVFRLYRWANGDSNTVPVQIFMGDPASQSSTFRWGDVMSVRGSGINTQIILDNNDAAQRYVAVLTPTDSTMTNWTAQYFLQPTVGTPIGRSLEFGPGSTFYQKRKGFGLVQSSFDLTQAPAATTTLSTNSNFTNTLAGVGLNLTRKLLAGVNYPVAATNDSLDLYEISDLNSPLFLASYIFPVYPHNANGNFISQTFFAGDMLFTIDAQNGIMAFKVALGPPTAPNFFAQPQNLRVILGGGGSMTVTLDQQATVKWQRNGSDIPGATNLTYAITNAQLTDGGNYRVIAANAYGSSTSSVAVVTVALSQGNYSLSQAWNLAPASRPYLPLDGSSSGSTPFYRSIAYSALSNQVYVVTRTGASSGQAVHVLDAATGADLYTLDTTGITGGSIVLLSVGVSQDGSIYAANMDTSGTNAAVYKLYRWADANSSTQPALVYSGEPANQTTGFRWGDAMDVRGAGTNTQIVIDANQGSLAAVLTPVDASLASFTNAYFGETGPSTPIGRSLQFATGTNIWQKRAGTALQLVSYNLPGGTSTVLSNFNNFASSLGSVALDVSRKLLAGVNFAGNTNSPDSLALYDISDLGAPLLLATYNFPANSKPNVNLIAQVVFAGNRVYAVDGNNGIVAFNLVAPTPPSLSVTFDGVHALVSWPTNFTGYALQSAPVLASPSIWSPEGTGAIANGQYTVTNTASGGSKYYRLIK
ncbi:immunoglobulin domain-containing protein [Pedosphaera parvula]|uniref:Immunoglobulin I-set domain protein n=1 Tax=Pedosphaera parvula (strain Ellin514) TaxID=320771 RepID=B9XID8_PEDPL|nr:immunoglobulin domain-containing protein [Pedosphaera parvula]EEF60399.1 Immunoglobulin I-set domain protein [Pedosphaera parvula Ellin514]